MNFSTVLHQAGRYGIQFREGMQDHAIEASVILATERIQSHYFILVEDRAVFTLRTELENKTEHDEESR